jgi:hypothetical protein
MYINLNNIKRIPWISYSKVTQVFNIPSTKQFLYIPVYVYMHVLIVVIINYTAMITIIIYIY